MENDTIKLEISAAVGRPNLEILINNNMPSPEEYKEQGRQIANFIWENLPCGTVDSLYEELQNLLDTETSQHE